MEQEERPVHCYVSVPDGEEEHGEKQDSGTSPEQQLRPQAARRAPPQPEQPGGAVTRPTEQQWEEGEAGTPQPSPQAQGRRHALLPATPVTTPPLPRQEGPSPQHVELQDEHQRQQQQQQAEAEEQHGMLPPLFKREEELDGRRDQQQQLAGQDAGRQPLAGQEQQLLQQQPGPDAAAIGPVAAPPQAQVRTVQVAREALPQPPPQPAPQLAPLSDEQADGFFQMLEEMAVGSSSTWLAVWDVLQQAGSGNERCWTVPLNEQREHLFGQYLAMQVELERQVEDVKGEPWLEVQQAAGQAGALALHSDQLQLLPAAIGQLSSLETLNLQGCSRLQRLPASLDQLSNLRILDLAGCQQLQWLPASIGALGGLEIWDCSGCSQLRELPPFIGRLQLLHTLDLSGCAQLEQLPAAVGQLSSLHTLHLQRCSRLQRLPDSLGRLSSLQWLDASECTQLRHLPASVGQLSRLCSLELQKCGQLRELPPSIGNLTCLINLMLSGCPFLQQLPASVGSCSKLERLYLSGCTGLQELPASLGQLAGLRYLHLAGCRQLARLPASLAQLEGLASLNLSGCSALQQLPDLSACSTLELCMASVLPDGSPVKMRPIRVPLDHLPPRLQQQQQPQQLLLDQAEVLRHSLSMNAWVCILLAAASFIGFVTVPGGYLDLGLVQLALKKPRINRAALRSYFICNCLTFFLALGTAVFCMTENMPHATAPTASRLILSVIASTLLLVLTVLAGAGTFLSGAYAVYPAAQYTDLIAPAAAAGSVLILMLWWHSRRVWRLYCNWRAARAAAPIPNLRITAARGSSVEKALRSILLK